MRQRRTKLQAAPRSASRPPVTSAPPRGTPGRPIAASIRGRSARPLASSVRGRSARPRAALEPPPKPTAADLKAAYGRTIPDLIAPGLDVLFCGINPGLYSAATRCHFARPGNRFWPALYAAGFTPRLLKPWERAALLACGCGVTNLVARGTANAAELDDDELRAGRRRLERKVRRYRPRVVAIVGIGAYRVAFNRPRAALGLQTEKVAGAALWVLPSTSGLNANHQPADFAEAFRALRRFVHSGR